MSETRCRRCLLRDTLDAAAYEQIVERAKRALPESVRAPEETVEKRLSLCRACEHLQDGACMRCGCLVEVRALRRDMHCPPPLRLW